MGTALGGTMAPVVLSASSSKHRLRLRRPVASGVVFHLFHFVMNERHAGATYMDRLLSLRLFCRVAAVESFSAAAGDFGLTQSAVSRGVAALEEDLGIKLLERSTRRVVLTPEGRRYKDRIEDHLRALQDADESAKSSFSDLAGQVRLSAPAALGRAVLLPEVLRILSDAPALRIETSLTDRKLNLIGGEYDFAIRVRTGGPPTWVERTVGHSEQWLVCAPRLFGGQPLPSSLSELAGLPAVVAGPPERFAQLGLELRLITDDLEGALGAVQSGTGLSALPRWLVGPHVERGELLRLLPALDVSRAPVFVTHPPRLRRVARHVLDSLVHRLAAVLDGS
jgi:DNA-binding transcriptional LysR family regulator